jgi:RimJ/RimL family protein N-acetyltransferase
MANFFVAPSARGRQLGSIMLMRFCEDMAERGFDRCFAHTTIDNTASQIAQRRAGFECVARRQADLTFARTLSR